jgi:hypothetical protein
MGRMLSAEASFTLLPARSFSRFQSVSYQQDKRGASLKMTTLRADLLKFGSTL